MANQFIDQQQSEDIRRTAAVAADYASLQGLILVGTGLGLVVIATGRSGWGAMIIALSVAIGSAWYQRTYGRAASRGSWVRSGLLALAGVLVVLVALGADRAVSWPVAFLPLAGALVLAASFEVGYPHVGVTRGHWATAAVLALFVFVPLLGVSSVSGPRPENLYASPADTVSLLALAGALVVVGVIDHLRLVRAMKAVPRD